MNLLSLYEKLEKLVQRLPESLQSPILREITPIKSLFLLQRPPRILVLGDRTASRTQLVNALFGTEVAQATEDHVQDGSWQLFSRAGHGSLRMLDARRPAALSLLRRALTTEAPDLCLFLAPEPQVQDDTHADLEHAGEIDQILRERHEHRPPMIGVVLSSSPALPSPEAKERLYQALSDPANRFRDRFLGVHTLPANSEDIHRLAAAIAAELPTEAKLEMARLSGVKELQHEIAQVIVKSMTAICGAIGAQPIPLADFPVLTALQAAMVAGIMHVSGREMSTKLAAEWIGALGANLGVALALREGARAMVKVIPVWGELVSSGIAAAGTYAIGRAAVAYFIDGVSLQDARHLFRKRKKPSALLKE